MFSAVQPALADHPVHYEHHRWEHTLLYQLIEEYYPAFKAHPEVQGTALPHHVERELEDYLGFPGPKTIWIGMQRCLDFALAIESHSKMIDQSCGYRYGRG